MFPNQGIPESYRRQEPLDDEGREGRAGIMEKYIGKIRPQILTAILLLGVISVLAMFKGMNEVTVGCIAGIIALAKDVLQVDSK
tara:strand:+ start:54 stop:305 length:252 start_codon:yes stop_codon:yes gene_type:complete